MLIGPIALQMQLLTPSWVGRGGAGQYFSCDSQSGRKYFGAGWIPEKNRPIDNSGKNVILLILFYLFYLFYLSFNKIELFSNFHLCLINCSMFEH